jgi:hypothetical protein
MFRPLIVGLLAAGAVFAAGLSGTPAQEKKDQPKKDDKKDPPKKKPRIAVAEPNEVAKDPDFAGKGRGSSASTPTRPRTR